MATCSRERRKQPVFKQHPGLIHFKRDVSPLLWRWLVSSDSLTHQLKSHIHNPLLVSCFMDEWQKSSALEAKLLLNDGLFSASDAKYGWVREVVLKDLEAPWIAARVFVPSSQIKGLRWIKTLGNRPLGDRLYPDKRTRRELLWLMPYCKEKKASHFRYPANNGFDTLLKALDIPDSGQRSHLWLRCSRITYKKVSFLVTELFLPALVKALSV